MTCQVIRKCFKPVEYLPSVFSVFNVWYAYRMPITENSTVSKDFPNLRNPQYVFFRIFQNLSKILLEFIQNIFRIYKNFLKIYSVFFTEFIKNF